MKSVLFRTGSIPAQPSFLPGSPRLSLSAGHNSFSGAFSGDKSTANSPRVSLHLEFSRRRDDPPPARTIPRALSESNMTRSDTTESEVSGGKLSKLGGVGSRSFHERIPEEECPSEGDDLGDVRSLLRSCYTDGNLPEREIPAEEFQLSGGGFGKGRKYGGSGGGTGGGGGGDCGFGAFTGGNADRSEIGAYYQEMLKSNPTNSLLLRNYGKYLQEVERDMVKAEEYYGRAALASPGDGEVLSLYGGLIWETQRDEVRAKCYFDQAVQASPDDCAVLGSYAHFMWEAEEEDDEDAEIKVESSPAMVAAF